jgi:putative ABC transport system permease protein
LLGGALITGVTVILFGVVPTFVAMRFDLSSPLRSDSRSGTEGRRLRGVRQILVASQIALAVVVLAGAGLLVRSLARLTSLDMGYTVEHLTMLNFSLPWRQFADDCRPKSSVPSGADSALWSRCAANTNFAAHDRVMAKLRDVPGIVSVSPEAVPPFLGSNVWMGRFAAQEQSDAESRANPWFGFDAVGADYFRTLGVPLLAGRVFTDADREDTPRVAVITEGVARRLWPNQSAVGKRIRSGEDHTLDSMITVVGVVREFHYREHRESTPTIFRPYRQELAQGYLVVRTRGSAVATESLRRAVEDAGGGATFIRAQSMDDLIAPQLATPRFDALLLSIFALAAIVLAAVGLYGIMGVGGQSTNARARDPHGAWRNLERRAKHGDATSADGRTRGDCRWARRRDCRVPSAHVDAFRDHAVRPSYALVPSRFYSSWSLPLRPTSRRGVPQ